MYQIVNVGKKKAELFSSLNFDGLLCGSAKRERTFDKYRHRGSS